jgi:hypothetical protein
MVKGLVLIGPPPRESSLKTYPWSSFGRMSILPTIENPGKSASPAAEIVAYDSFGVYVEARRDRSLERRISPRLMGR